MRNDILNNSSDKLRQMPYSVPDGYFEGFIRRNQISGAAEQTVSATFMRKLAPYLSMAAAFLLIVTVGRFLVQYTSTDGEMTYEDYLVHSDIMIEAEYENDIQIAEALPAEEDIIEYLIYTGVTAETIEFSK